jgi:hypothetical protein
MVDLALEIVAQRAAAHMRAVFRWLIATQPDQEDASMYAILVRAEILAMADSGNLAHLGVTSGEQICGLVVEGRVRGVDCDASPGDVRLIFDWNETPLAPLANRPDPEEN